MAEPRPPADDFERWIANSRVQPAPGARRTQPAGMMVETHTQPQCRDCGLWAVWALKYGAFMGERL